MAFTLISAINPTMHCSPPLHSSYSCLWWCEADHGVSEISTYCIVLSGLLSVEGAVNEGAGTDFRHSIWVALMKSTQFGQACVLNFWGDFQCDCKYNLHGMMILVSSNHCYVILFWTNYTIYISKDFQIICSSRPGLCAPLTFLLSICCESWKDH